MRVFALLAYFFIFLQGSMILIPFGLFLFTGLFEAEPLMRVLILLADISLIALMIASFNEKSRLTLVIEIIAYILLLLPIVKIFFSFPFDRFNYFLFIFPTLCYLVLFPISIVVAYRKKNYEYICYARLAAPHFYFIASGNCIIAKGDRIKLRN